MSDLAQRLSAHPRFRWAPGMLGVRRCGGPLRYVGGPWWVRSNANESDEEGDWPDLSDPATAGVLLGMLDALSPVSVFNAGRVDGGWWTVTDGDREWHSSALGQALAQALLDVWGEP